MINAFRIFVLALCGCVILTSCLKNKDSTSGGPKSALALTSFVLNGSINALLDNSAITTNPLLFGTSVTSTSSTYMVFPAGLHNFQIITGTSVLSNNTVSLDSGSRFSLFVYDSVKDNTVKLLLLKDDLTAVDTVARIRFLEFIPVTDSITLMLTKDNVSYSIKNGYLGKAAGSIQAIAFSLSLPQGTYQSVLQRNGVAISMQASFTVNAGKLYSIIAKGAIGGTGDYKESVVMIANN